MLTVSVVSHGHARLVETLLQDLAACEEIGRVVLTLNVPEEAPSIPTALADKTVVMENSVPKGFGANHNAAFAHCTTPYFCVVNPDVRCPDDPFPVLVAALESLDAAVVGPAVVNAEYTIEDNVRYFPTLLGLLSKVLGLGDGRYSYRLGDPPFQADWVGGMFLLFRSTAFRTAGGFDEGFFLYYEDVDICARLWSAGRSVLACPRARVVHEARRASHRQARHLRWHLASMARYFRKYLGRLPRTARAP